MDDEGEPTLQSYEMYKAEGDLHLMKGLLAKAVDNYTKALKVRKDDPYVLVARARTYAKMGIVKESLDDVNTVLKDDPNNHQALHQKAETLYIKGNFELALVYYHRGQKLKPESEIFRLGIQKAQEAIDSAVGDETQELSKEGDISFFQRELEEERVAKLIAKTGGVGAVKRKKTTDEVDKRPLPPRVSKERRIHELLRNMYGDRTFLDDVIREADRKTKTGGVVYDHAWDAIMYLEQRTEFWRQEQPPMTKARKRDKTPVSTEKMRINNWVSREVDKIDYEQCRHKWDESLTRAFNLLAAIDKFAPGVVNRKAEIMATVNSYIGNALLQLNQPEKALDHFRMEKSLADQYGLPDSKARALDNMGRAYAKMGCYKKAINIWNVRLPVTKTPLERTWLYHEMGRCHFELGNYHRARELGERSYHEATLARDKVWLLSSSILTAQAQVKLENIRGALDTFHHALDLATALDDELSTNAIKRAIDELNKRIVGHLVGVERVEIISEITADLEVKAEDTKDQAAQTEDLRAVERAFRMSLTAAVAVPMLAMKAEEVAESAEEEKEEKEEAVVVKKEKVEVAVPSLLEPCLRRREAIKKRQQRKAARLQPEAEAGDEEEREGLEEQLHPDEAYVTLATNDVYAVGAMVLAYSIRATCTTRHLVAMVTPDVTASVRDVMRQFFDVVVDVSPIDSNDFDNLSLLNRSELGITFTKLHCWRLTQYNKCVFLDADTLVLGNIDDLFERDELSAAPDAGWPDCFNSGVFVFVPSLETFAKLMEFAWKVGSFDGGDQGLLNLYFETWSVEDITKHLPFTDNLMAHAFYSYMPAYKYFGSQTRVVHFIGAMKPWHYEYDTTTCRLKETGTISPHLLQMWWDIFLAFVNPRLSRHMPGLVGQLALLQVTVVGDYSEEDLAERQRQFKWERSEIDYMGTDSFVHIMRRLDESIYGHWQTVPELPSPAPSLTNLTPSSTKLLGEVQPCVVEYPPPDDEARDRRTPTPRPPPPPIPPPSRATEVEKDDDDGTRSAKRPKDDAREATAQSEETPASYDGGKDDDKQRPTVTSGEEDKERRTTSGEEQDEDKTKSATPPDDETRQSTVTAGEEHVQTEPDEKQEQVDKTAEGDNQPDGEKTEEADKKEEQ